MSFRYQMEKQVLGKVDGNPACGDTECHAPKVGHSPLPWGSFLFSESEVGVVNSARCQQFIPCGPRFVPPTKALKLDPTKTKFSLCLKASSLALQILHLLIPWSQHTLSVGGK